MKKAKLGILIWILLFMLLPFVHIGEYYIIFKYVSVFRGEIFVLSIIFNCIITGLIVTSEKNLSWCFYGKKTTVSDERQEVDRFYRKLKPLIVIAYLVAIVLFSMTSGISELFSLIGTSEIDAEKIGDYIIIGLVLLSGIAGFVFCMVISCMFDFDFTLNVCSHCQRVTKYKKTKTRTIVEPWREDDYRVSSYTTKEKIGEYYDSNGNSGDVYGDVTHYEDVPSYTYHPGLYEFEYTCDYCGYSFTKTVSK